MFFQGFILGLSIAAPVGPIGLLCLQRTLARGRLHGFVSGLGAATADALYGLVAALGLGVVTTGLLGVRVWLQLGGGLFLVWLGGKTLRAPAEVRPRGGPEDRAGLAAAFLSVGLLTLANPATILSFLGVFAGLGVASTTRGPAAALPLVAGVFLGSATWWLLLSTGAGLVRGRLNERHLRLINLLAGACLLGLGMWSLISAALVNRPDSGQ